MKNYDKDKNSGVEWLDKIPNLWKTIPFKRLFSFGRGLSITKADLVEDGLPVISYGQIHSKKNTGTRIEEHLLRYVPESYAKGNENSLLKQGDFIFADTSEDIEGCGNCVYMDKEMVLYAGYHTIIAKARQSDHSKYLAYLFKTDCWRSQIRSSVNGVKVFSITQNALYETSVLLPPIEEQRIITNYLDNKVNQIDAIIAEKEAMVEDLQSYRKSIITETVTRGLNPDVPKKDSGIDWMGMIPEHWIIAKTSYLFEEIGSGTTPNTNNEKYYVENGINWLQTGDLNDGYIDKTTKHISSKALAENSALRIYPKGSLVIAMYGATIGKVGILNIESTTNQACCVLANSKSIIGKYAYYVFIASKQSLVNLAFGGGQPNISQSIIRNHKLPVPSLEEQQAIVAHLDSKMQGLDFSISELQSQIEDLKLYKASIITEAVTGKIDLR